MNNVMQAKFLKKCTCGKELYDNNVEFHGVSDLPIPSEPDKVLLFFTCQDCKSTLTIRVKKEEGVK